MKGAGDWALVIILHGFVILFVIQTTRTDRGNGLRLTDHGVNHVNHSLGISWKLNAFLYTIYKRGIKVCSFDIMNFSFDDLWIFDAFEGLEWQARTSRARGYFDKTPPKSS